MSGVIQKFLKGTRAYYARQITLQQWLTGVDDFLKNQDQSNIEGEVFAKQRHLTVWERDVVQFRFDHVGALVYEPVEEASEALAEIAQDVSIEGSVAMASLVGTSLSIVRGRVPCPVCTTCKERYIELFVVQGRLPTRRDERRIHAWARLGAAMHLGFSVRDADVAATYGALSDDFVSMHRLALEERTIHYLDGFLDGTRQRIEVFSEKEPR